VQDADDSPGAAGLPERAAPAEWGATPFLGAKPQALALLQLDAAAPGRAGLAQAASALHALVSDIARNRVRCQLGVGAPLFEALPAAERPRGLGPLRLNGDDAHGLRVGADETGILVALGGERDQLTALASEAVAALGVQGLIPRAWHFGESPSSARDHTGFLDGTSNLQELTDAQFAACVFVQPEDDAPFAGGAYLVMRKYEEDLHMWNDLPVEVQELFVGRRRDSGLFLDGRNEWIPATWEVTPPYAHVRRAQPRGHAPDDPGAWMQRIYRRSVKFVESDAPGVIRYGYLFLALVRDPFRQFVRIHNEQLIPASGTRDHFLVSGYLKPAATACYYLAPNERVLRLLEAA
jgi:Dyp-type peroxidase family